MATRSFELVIAGAAFTVQDYFELEYGDPDENEPSSDEIDDGPVELDDDGQAILGRDLLRRWTVTHDDHDLVIVLSRLGEAVCAEYIVCSEEAAVADATIRDYATRAKQLGRRIEDQV